MRRFNRILNVIFLMTYSAQGGEVACTLFLDDRLTLLCIGIGLCIGLLAGLLLNHCILKAGKEKGYQITQVIPAKDGGSLVIITDKNGTSQNVEISQKQMRQQNFSAGGYVFINKKEKLEWASLNHLDGLPGFLFVVYLSLIIIPQLVLFFSLILKC